MATFYGSDTTCVSDVPLIDLQITNPNILIGQRIARLLQTPRGGFAAIGGDPDRGLDVRQFLNAKISPTTLAQAQQQIVNECLKDEEVQSATCTATMANGVLTIALNIVAASGPFLLTLNVSQLTVDAVFNF